MCNGRQDKMRMTCYCNASEDLHNTASRRIQQRTTLLRECLSTRWAKGPVSARSQMATKQHERMEAIQMHRYHHKSIQILVQSHPNPTQIQRLLSNHPHFEAHAVEIGPLDRRPAPGPTQGLNHQKQTTFDKPGTQPRQDTWPVASNRVVTG